MANDNGSFWKGYLGYPSIAFLFSVGSLEYRSPLGLLLKSIKWKDINVKFKNDFEKTIQFIEAELPVENVHELSQYIDELEVAIRTLNLVHLGPKTKPPEGY